MAPAETETAAIIAVDHSNVLTRRRRSAMKLGQLARRDAAQISWTWLRGRSRHKAPQASRTGQSALNPAPLTARAETPKYGVWGWSPPKPTATADDSYRVRLR